MTLNKVYIVWGNKQNTLSVPLEDKAKAEVQAETLALAHPNETFYVFESVSRFNAVKVAKQVF